MATFLAALPYLLNNTVTAGGLSGFGGLANILGGGTLAGSTMGNGIQGPTRGSGLMGILSGGAHMDNIIPSNFTSSKNTFNTGFNLPIPEANFKATQPNFYR